MTEFGGHPGFAQESPTREFSVDLLDRNVPMQLGIPGLPHFARTTEAESFLDRVFTNSAIRALFLLLVQKVRELIDGDEFPCHEDRAEERPLLG
jgi:hypothetical protein